MGQRSQIYIRYNNEKVLVAKHLQWNYGYYMIQRAHQILDFLNKNTKDEYSNFLSENFDLCNRKRYDLEICNSLISLNLGIGSYVPNCDLVKEQLEFLGRNESKDEFLMNPMTQDNNNGIFVVDIQEKQKKVHIKYAFCKGYEELDTYFEKFIPCSAIDYINAAEPNYELLKREFYEEEELYELKSCYENAKLLAKYIDGTYELLSEQELEDIFNKKYLYRDCLTELEYNTGIQKAEKNIKENELLLKRKLIGTVENLDSSEMVNISEAQINTLEESFLLKEIKDSNDILYYSYRDKALVEVNSSIYDLITDENRIKEIINNKN